MSNNVWIELEKPRDDAHAKEICEQANRMLQRMLGTAPWGRFGWDGERKQYKFGGLMGYRGLTDRGEWFNLDYLGRPFEEGELK